ncbi:MAG: TetR family transcriptional regulator [Candidatus Dormibacteria bacterium]
MPPSRSPAGAATPSSGETVRERILRTARLRLRSGALPPMAALAREAGVSRATLYRLVASRAELLRLLEVGPDPSARERILAEAVTLIGEHGLAGLSMDELAARAGVSRASLYRLYPGKPALFREVVRSHAPFIPVALALAGHANDAPEVVMPAVAQAFVRSTQGRVGLFRTLLFEVSGPDADAELARDLAISETIAPLAAYVAGQMSEGRLRSMDPLLALLSFVGPLVMHLITRDVMGRALGLDTRPEVVGAELASAWLRAMRPGEEAA